MSQPSDKYAQSLDDYVAGLDLSDVFPVVTSRTRHRPWLKCSNPTCQFHQGNPRRSDFEMLCCSGCKRAETFTYYCNRECQRVHWKEHKIGCSGRNRGGTETIHRNDPRYVSDKSFHRWDAVHWRVISWGVFQAFHYSPHKDPETFYAEFRFNGFAERNGGQFIMTGWSFKRKSDLHKYMLDNNVSKDLQAIVHESMKVKGHLSVLIINDGPGHIRPIPWEEYQGFYFVKEDPSLLQQPCRNWMTALVNTLSFDAKDRITDLCALQYCVERQFEKDSRSRKKVKNPLKPWIRKFTPSEIATWDPQVFLREWTAKYYLTMAEKQAELEGTEDDGLVAPEDLFEPTV